MPVTGIDVDPQDLSLGDEFQPVEIAMKFRTQIFCAASAHLGNDLRLDLAQRHDVATLRPAPDLVLLAVPRPRVGGRRECRDADQGSSNDDLAQFFQETKEEYSRRADKAKELLAREMSNSRSAAG